MQEDIRKYAKLGLVHHLLYPACTEDAAYHADTLAEFVKREDIEALDCCLPYGDGYRKKLIPIVKGCGKDVSFALHLFPARKISLASTDVQEQNLARLVIADQIAMAGAAGATGFVFPSGADVPENRPAAQEAFYSFCLWFCGELAKYNITALLEPFDRTVDKKFLYGPIDDCVALVDRVRESCPNMGIELDMAHLPLMGEGFADSIRRCGDRIRRVHLGNCVLKDRTHPLYGDCHPPMNLPGGEIGKEELIVILAALLEYGFLDKADRKPLIMEMRPFPGRTPEYTVEKTVELLEEAWLAV